MGYFNYFIKCIIRNIAYRLCKPKVLLTVLFSVAILFILHTTGYCAEWTDGDIEQCLNGLADITSNQGVIISQLSSMGVNVSDIENKLNSVNNELANISAYTNLTNAHLTDLISKVDSINTALTELAQQQNIYYENFSNELQTIRETLLGSESTPVSATDLGIYSINAGGDIYHGIRQLYIPMKYNYTYKINLTYTNNENSSIPIYYFTYDKSIVNTNEVINRRFVLAGTIPANSTGTVTIYCRDYTEPYIYTWYGYSFSSIDVSCSIEGIIDILDRTNNQVVENIQQGNQLQQEQNQLQQEQNDFLKDDNVNTDGLEFATDDTVNPTTDGFNTLFNTVYNAFCNTSSEPLTITLPYINKTFTIQPNIVSNGMQKAGLGVIVSLISSFYYFSVCLFIYKDIAKIIDNLKSGNITADCGNVKTEVL